MNIKLAVKDLAYDLRKEGYDKKQLKKVCEKEASRFGLPPVELAKKIERAYQALFVFG